MTAHPIGTIRTDGTVTCNLCRWETVDRLDAVGALSQHRSTDHPDARATSPAPAPAVEPTRHPAGIVLGALLAVLFGIPAAAAWSAGGWWIAAAIPAGLMAALGLFGAVTDAQRAPRDGKGRRIR